MRLFLEVEEPTREKRVLGPGRIERLPHVLVAEQRQAIIDRGAYGRHEPNRRHDERQTQCRPDAAGDSSLLLSHSHPEDSRQGRGP